MPPPTKSRGTLTRKDYLKLLSPVSRSKKVKSVPLRRSTRARKPILRGSGRYRGELPIKSVDKIPSQIRKHLNFLMMISDGKINMNQRRALINKMSPPQMKAVTLLTKMFLSRKIPISSTLVKRLNRDRDFIRNIADDKHSNFNKKRRLLQQKGGFLRALVPIATSIAAPILSKIIGKILK